MPMPREIRSTLVTQPVCLWTHLGHSGTKHNGPYSLPSGIRPGDIIFANWGDPQNLNGVQANDPKGIHHAGIAIAPLKGDVLLVQHHAAIERLSDWQRKADGVGLCDTYVWIVRPS